MNDLRSNDQGLQALLGELVGLESPGRLEARVRVQQRVRRHRLRNAGCLALVAGVVSVAVVWFRPDPGRSVITGDPVPAGTALDGSQNCGAQTDALRRGLADIEAATVPSATSSNPATPATPSNPANPGSAPPAVTGPSPVGGWTTISTVPVQPWAGTTLVWTGELLVLVHGHDTRTDRYGPSVVGGTVIDPEHGTQRALPPSPLAGGGDAPVTSAVWTGTEVLVWNRSGAASWHPGTGTWQLHEGFPADAEAAVWTGSRLKAWQAGVSYRPSDDQTGPYAAFTDDFLVAMGWDGHRVVAVDSDAYAAAYDPARDEWATLPLVPVLSCVEGAKVHAGSARPLVVEKCGVLATLGPGDTWTSVGNYPGHVTVTADAIYSVGPAGVYRLALSV